MSKKRMKHHLRGAFTVNTPAKRLRMWVGLPIMLGVGSISQAITVGKQKDLVLNDHPVQAAALAASPMALVGAVLTAIPYTRWAGALVLGWSVLSFGGNALANRTQAAKDAYSSALTGANGVQILRG